MGGQIVCCVSDGSIEEGIKKRKKNVFAEKHLLHEDDGYKWSIQKVQQRTRIGRFSSEVSFCIFFSQYEHDFQL